MLGYINYFLISAMHYEQIYNKDYFSGKTSFFYKLGYGNFAKLYFDNLFKRLTPCIDNIQTGKVLDVGCEYGLMLKRVPASFEKFGIDVSDYAIHMAKKRFPSMTFRVSNVEDALPFPEETLICSSLTIWPSYGISPTG